MAVALILCRGLQMAKAKGFTTEPKVDRREASNYVGIRTQVPRSGMGKFVRSATKELFEWLGARGITSMGPPFLRYYVIDMEGSMDLEIGVPVNAPIEGDDRVKAGVLPAGEYASLVYTNARRGYAGNKALVEWARDKGLKWDRWDDPNGDAFASRYESFLTDPADEPDMGKWDTEVAIKLAE